MKSYRIDIEAAERIENTFAHHPPVGDQLERYNLLREHAKAFAYLIASSTPKSREQSLAFTHLEEAVFFANAAIARHGAETDLLEFERLERNRREALGPDKYTGCYGGHDPNELPGLEDSEQAGGDSVPPRFGNVIPA